MTDDREARIIRAWPAAELDRPPLAGRSIVDPKQEPTRRSSPMKGNVRLRGKITFTPTERREDPRLRDLELAYSESDEHIAIPHRPLEGEDDNADRRVTYLRRADFEAMLDDRARRRVIADVFPDADVNLFSYFERTGGARS